MEKLTAEMKAELAAKKLAAEVNAKLRTKRPEVKLTAPRERTVKILPEAKEDPYRRANPVSRYFDTIEYEEVMDNYTK